MCEGLTLNEKGQCPPCGRKPIPYKRDGHWYCCKCNRAYSMATGEQIQNWAWVVTPTGFDKSDLVKGAEAAVAARESKQGS